MFVLIFQKRIAKEDIQSFISKLTDSDAENSETQTWLEFSLACEYIEKQTFDTFLKHSEEVGKLINYMINNPGKFGSK